MLAWGRQYPEEEQTLFGDGPWPYEVARNRARLERFRPPST